ALATRRWLTMRFLTTTAAPLTAASPAAASPICHLKATLPGATSWICTAPVSAAFAVAVTAGRTSQSTLTFSAASSAAAWLSAMTIADGLPTLRGTSASGGGCGGRCYCGGGVSRVG